ncbi:DEAD/DEAH box helicase [Cryptosporangium sp. NPDC051539]|uniref:DEAD/DEAH box helicase n=1 Tax=Cryptosporangium sp. NPDC051539 TaxID=3363962 RepID=UPI0037A0BB4D
MPVTTGIYQGVCALGERRRPLNTDNNTPDADSASAQNLDPVELEHATTGAPDVEAVEELAATKPVSEQNPLFADLGVRAETVEALASVGITRAFAIQELTLPIALAGNDLIGQARTGTGKTLGFGVPLLQRIVAPGEGDRSAGGAPQALVVVPTRELCVQVTRDIAAAGKTRGVRVLSVYGGRAYEPQIAALKKGVEVVVGTPGRLLDLVEQRHLHLGAVSILVLDEADEMLDLGFLPDIERILATIPSARQTMLFSATMPGPIVALARHFMRQPVHIRAEEPDAGRTVPTTAQHIYRAHSLDKAEMLARILQARDRGLTMVFCRTKRTAQKVSDDLEERGFAAAAVHGDLGQGAREQALRAFRSGKVDVLVATDVAARGIDVTGVTHVINYQCPEDEKTYLHRIGRTGRAGADGVAVTFVDWDELTRWTMINTALDLPFADPPETYSTSEHLHQELDIPDDATGVLPRKERTRAGLDAEEVEDLGETGGKKARQTRVRRRGGSDLDRRPAAEADGGTDEELPARRRTKARRRTRGGELLSTAPAPEGAAETPSEPDEAPVVEAPKRARRTAAAEAPTALGAVATLAPPLFRTPDPVPEAEIAAEDVDADVDDAAEGDAPRRRRRRRGGVTRTRRTGSEAADAPADASAAE